MEPTDKPTGVQLAWPIKQSSRPPTPARTSQAEVPKGEQSSAKRRKTSDIWNHFTKTNDGTTTKAICLSCGSTLSAQSSAGTNHLWRHHHRCKAEPRQSLLIPRQSVSQLDRMPRFNQDAIRESLAKMIVALQFPFSMVEDQSFREFVAPLQPKFKMIDQATLQEDCMNLHKKRKAVIAKQLDEQHGKIALTVERWSCQYTSSYLKISAQYINPDWKLINRTIGFRLLPEPIDENVIVECITNVLEDWKLVNKCGSITAESSISTDRAVKKIREILHERQILEPGEGYFHMGCGAAAIKQIAQDAFKTTQEVITKLRQVVRLVTYSDASEESFKEVAINCGLPLTNIPSRDIVDRWDSTYSMISDALNFQRAFEHLQATKPEYLDGPTATEWLHLETIKDALEVFHDAAGSLSSTDSPSANRSYLSMKKIERYLSKPEHYENNHSINIISPMANAFEKYWGTIQEFSEIASILDPRLKLQYLEFSLVKQHGAAVIQEKLAIAKNRLSTMFQTYLPGNPAVECDLKTNDAKAQGKNVDDDIDEFQKYLAGTTMIQTPYGSRTAELDLYLQEPVFQAASLDQTFDVLGWWKANELRFPTLVLLARNVLTIPMSSSTPEYTFKTSEKILNDFHSSLEPECLEAMICAGNWLQADHPPPKSS